MPAISLRSMSRTSSADPPRRRTSKPSSRSITTARSHRIGRDRPAILLEGPPARRHRRQVPDRRAAGGANLSAHRCGQRPRHVHHGISMDETDTPQTRRTCCHPGRAGRRGHSAPNCGTQIQRPFNKGVDYVGDVRKFAARVRAGPGSTPFCDRAPSTCRESQAQRPFRQRQVLDLRPHPRGLQNSTPACHLKTAGTTLAGGADRPGAPGDDGLSLAKGIYTKPSPSENSAAPTPRLIDIDPAQLPTRKKCRNGTATASPRLCATTPPARTTTRTFASSCTWLTNSPRAGPRFHRRPGEARDHQSPPKSPPTSTIATSVAYSARNACHRSYPSDSFDSSYLLPTETPPAAAKAVSRRRRPDQAEVATPGPGSRRILSSTNRTGARTCCRSDGRSRRRTAASPGTPIAYPPL